MMLSSCFFCVFTASCLLLCQAVPKSTLYKLDSQLKNKKILGDALLTYNDVTTITCAWHCSSSPVCGFFSYNKLSRKCVVCQSLFVNVNLVDEDGWTTYALNHDVPDTQYDANFTCPDTSSPDCWTRMEGASLSHVSVGPAGMWGVDHALQIFYRNDTYSAPQSKGSLWQHIVGQLVNIDVGTNNVWGVNPVQEAFDRPGISSSNPLGSAWTNQTGPNTTLWTSVSPAGSLWMIDTFGNLMHRRNSSNSSPFGSGWDTLLASSAVRVDAGQAGVWVLDTSGQLLYRHGTYGDTLSTDTEWRAVSGPSPGTLISVSSGRNVVVVADASGRVWMRIGLGQDTQSGLAWVRLSGHLKQVEVYETEAYLVLWAVDFTSPYQQIFHKVLNK